MVNNKMEECSNFRKGFCECFNKMADECECNIDCEGYTE